MRVVSHIDGFWTRVGGEAHSGWLPAGAAEPLPTPEREVVLDLVIEFDGHGYLLIVRSVDGSVRGDTWHETAGDANATAEERYQVAAEKWVEGEGGEG
jgi:hypothetical protein